VNACAFSAAATPSLRDRRGNFRDTSQRWSRDRTVAAVIARRPGELHFGGGTPPPFSAQLRQIATTVLSAFTPSGDAEMGVEIDPMTTTPEHFSSCASSASTAFPWSAGFCRRCADADRAVPTGCQTTEVFVQAAPTASSALTWTDVRSSWPGRGSSRALSSTRVELGADRVAVFGYAHVPWLKPHQKKLGKHGVPPAASRWKMFNARAARFCRRVPCHRMDHFAKAGDELALAGKSAG